MEKRYQVFVSSTYEDLIEERQQVMHALLELDCMPAGMELFPAADEDQWTMIKKVIDDCDYYIVIVGGRYGSLGPEGKSYTEMEYIYAADCNKPIIAFLHKDPELLPAKKTEKSPPEKDKLDLFRALLQKKVCKSWNNAEELGSVVSRSIIKLMKTHPAIGWIKADNMPTEDTFSEIVHLQKRVKELENQLATVSINAPIGTEIFDQGGDRTSIRYVFDAEDKDSIGWGGSAIRHLKSLSASWNDIFGTIAPLMMDEASDKNLQKKINHFIREKTYDILIKESDLSDKAISGFSINQDDFMTIVVQLRALGLIVKSIRPRSVYDNDTYWSLTPYGDSQMIKLRAISKNALKTNG